MNEYLESLRAYAVAPLGDSPPDILPWDHGDRWGLDGAARGTLGLLLAGEGPGERLYAAASYLLCFSIEGFGSRRFGGRRQFPDAPLLNGTALALCGYLCHGRHPEGDLWRVTGCARLATEVHARRAALNDRMSADCLLAVCRVADELELPLLADLITLRERMWGRLLDHRRAERLHVAEQDYASWMDHPAPADQVGALMAARAWQYALPSTGYREEVDLQAADAACENRITLRAHMLVRHQFGAEIDWHLRLFDDIESTVSLGTQLFIRNLALAYAETARAKYAQHAARLLWSFYRTAPLPNHRQLAGPWRTLEVGNRQCNMWPVILTHLGQSSAFDEATHAMLARSRLEHMRYALAYCGGANNWYQVESAGLAVAALYSPELTHAKAFLRIALRRLRWINSFAYYDDGFQFELTPGYHVYPTSSMFAVVQAARARGVSLPKDFVGLMERAHEMYLYAVQPNHQLPMLNDCNPHPFEPASLLCAAAETFARKDFLWGGTKGARGGAPDHCSHNWPLAGYAVMRDRWGPEGQYLFFDAAPFGASHQHEDKLSFVLYSHGRLLVGDPNIYSYSRTELTHYFRSSRAHNVVLIDGQGQARRLRPESLLSTQGRREWVSRRRFDFMSGEYVEGYAPDPYEEPGQELQVDDRFTHRRAIFYLKPNPAAGVQTGYWILTDLIGGAEGETHTLEQILHLAPVYQPGEEVAFRAGEISIGQNAVVTTEPDLANLAILPVDTKGLEVRAQKGETSPAVGWYGVLGEFPAWDVTLECSRTLPARMDLVLWPMAPGESSYPTVTRLAADQRFTALHIDGPGIDDTFLLCEQGAGPVRLGGLTFEGRALLLRRKPTLEALAVEPVTVSLGATGLAPVG